MITNRIALFILSLALWTTPLLAQNGPFDPEAWPPTLDNTKLVDYIVTDPGLDPPGYLWFPDSLIIQSGGDQVTEPITIGGHTGVQVIGNFLNVADTYFDEWADNDFIDILVQVYGNEALIDPEGAPREYEFLIGTLPDPNLTTVPGGTIAPEANNKKWNWVLFRIPNDLRPSGESRYVGTVPAGAQGNTLYGGVNGGTIRFDTVPGWIVRVVAFGEQGAFGEPEQINQFLPPDSCDPEPETNLASIDINAGMTNHLVVLDDGNQTVVYSDSVGPGDDLRKAVAPTGSFLNFGITEEYLGKPCNDPRTVKVCVEFYDDPAFLDANVRFGPETYATDSLGGTGVFPEASRHLMEGSGQWIRRSWSIPSVNLQGVNAGPYTGGPRFVSTNAAVYVSKLDLAVLRTGDHPLAGIDPLADCFTDPKICENPYGLYVELDLQNAIQDGLAVGASQGDQEMIVEEAGPIADRRQAVRPAFDDGTPGSPHRYLNFAIQNEALGPNSQPPAHLAICVTYYDDPALVGATFRPEVYMTEVNGAAAFGFTPGDYEVTVEGTDQWRTAYWEIPDMKFIGVNQTPQAAARFTLSDKVFFTSVRYAVIPPCGSMAGINLLEECKPVVEDVMLQVEVGAGAILIGWPMDSGDYVLQETPDLTTREWSPVVATPEEVDGNYVVTIPVEGETRFYRLIQ